jgi:hypothetical protein
MKRAALPNARLNPQSRYVYPHSRYVSTQFRYILRFQNSPVKPTFAKIACASSIVGRLKSASSRLPYHWRDSAHACAIVIVAPRDTPAALHQRSTASSDRKRRMLAHV